MPTISMSAYLLTDVEVDARVEKVWESGRWVDDVSIDCIRIDGKEISLTQLEKRMEPEMCDDFMEELGTLITEALGGERDED